METKAKAPRRPVLNLVVPQGVDPDEDKHQETLFATVALHKKELPELEDLFHVPNGGKRDIGTALALQRRGVKPGVPDLYLDIPRTCADGVSYHGLRIELKRFRNGALETEQKERLTRLAASGYRAIVCWGWIAAWEEILWYLGRDDLLLPSRHFTTEIVQAFPESPFWQRKNKRIARPSLDF